MRDSFAMIGVAQIFYLVTNACQIDLSELRASEVEMDHIGP